MDEILGWGMIFYLVDDIPLVAVDDPDWGWSFLWWSYVVFSYDAAKELGLV